MTILKNGREIKKSLINKTMNPYDFFNGADKIFNTINAPFLKNLDKEIIETIEILTHSKNIDPFYYPPLRNITGSVGASILFVEILKNLINDVVLSEKPFLKAKFRKFKEPCNHPFYSEIGSWSDELNFTAREITTALKKTTFKITSKNQKEKIPNNFLFLSKTDRDNITWYKLNPNYKNKK
jgi:hypothetical protein